MRLQEIAAYLEISGVNVPDVEVKNICFDSRQVQPEDLFIALNGAAADGHNYIEKAYEKGATAALVERTDINFPEGLIVLVVPNTHLAFAKLAKKLYDAPDKSMLTVGVTGTNGKTTTTNLVKYLMEAKGKKMGLIGTIQNMVGNEKIATDHTTPDALTLAELMGKMRDAKCDGVVMEVSSHALSQYRVDCCEFDVAVFTNLTQDHLDYHKTIENYRNAKTRLFKIVKKSGYCIVNLDDPSALEFVKASNGNLITYAINAEADLKACDIQIHSGGTDFNLYYAGKKVPFHVPLMGNFNVYNALAATAVALSQGMDVYEIAELLHKAPQVAGRFEMVNMGQDFTVIVDYAHTPDGLENVLNTAREITKGRLISVFGCGGDRDNTKRPIMGRISGKLADFSVVTSDNPRTEDPMKIIGMVEAGIKEVTDQYVVEENRGKAIEKAINMAKAGDIVLIAGKGHEDYQLVMGEVLHFDDREEARKVLAKLVK